MTDMYDRCLTIPDAMSDFLNLSRSSAAVVVRLQESKGRIVTHWDLQLAVEAATGNLNSVETLRSTVKRARQAIKGHIKIIAACGVGYRIEWNKNHDPRSNPLDHDPLRPV